MNDSDISPKHWHLPSLHGTITQYSIIIVMAAVPQMIVPLPCL
jgi:hypothetical protein